MHSTVVVLWIDLDRQSALWSHVGDSRLYRVRRGVADRVDLGRQRRPAHGRRRPHHGGAGRVASAEEPADRRARHRRRRRAAHRRRARTACSRATPSCCAATAGGALSTTRRSPPRSAAPTGPDEWLALMQQAHRGAARRRARTTSARSRVWVARPDESTRPMTMPSLARGGCAAPVAARCTSSPRSSAAKSPPSGRPVQDVDRIADCGLR